MRLRVGDVIEIPLSDGSRAFCRYVERDETLGPIVEVYSKRLSRTEDVDIERLGSTGLLFPPVVVGLSAALHAGLWRIVGHIPVRDYLRPLFLAVRRGKDPFRVVEWFLWDGHAYKRLGAKLPQQYKRLEIDFVWTAQDLADRIETGVDPFRSPLREG
jgi:hypothetical protein